MTLLGSLVTRPRRPRGEVTQAVGVAAVAAGVAVLLATLVGAGAAEHHADGGTASHLHDVGTVAAMTLVMMAPFAVPLAGAVSRATVWWRARVAATAAVVAYLGLWVAAAGALHVAGEVLVAVATPVGAVAGLTVATVAEQLSRSRARVLAACQATRPVRERSVVRGGLVWGLSAGMRCVRSCALPMALMAVAPGVLAFAGVTVLLWAERFGPRPRHRVVLALGYLAVGVAQSVTVIVQR